MAHFAEIKQKTDPSGFTSNTVWVVERVVVVDNSVVPSDKHPAGEAWCQKFFNGGTWKQCSYNNNFRGKFPGLSDIYDETRDAFYRIQPHASWTLNENNQWEAPVAMPPLKEYTVDDVVLYSTPKWDEDNQLWFCTHNEVTFNWNPDTSTWVQQ